jgi:hypothetical protein
VTPAAAEAKTALPLPDKPSIVDYKDGLRKAGLPEGGLPN